MAYIPKKELKRQLFHILFGLAIALLLHLNVLNKVSLLIALIASVVVCVISRKMKIPGIYWFLDKLEREEDLIKFPGKGALFYLISSFAVVLLFPKDIAIASILILALGDSASNIAGRLGGMRHPFSDKKFLEGFVAGLIAAFIASYIVLNNIPEAALGSFAAMFVESLEIYFRKKRVDDNLLIPIVAALVIAAVRYVSGML